MPTKCRRSKPCHTKRYTSLLRSDDIHAEAANPLGQDTHVTSRCWHLFILNENNFFLQPQSALLPFESAFVFLRFCDTTWEIQTKIDSCRGYQARHARVHARQKAGWCSEELGRPVLLPPTLVQYVQTVSERNIGEAPWGRGSKSSADIQNRKSTRTCSAPETPGRMVSAGNRNKIGKKLWWHKNPCHLTSANPEQYVEKGSLAKITLMSNSILDSLQKSNLRQRKIALEDAGTWTGKHKAWSFC